VAWARRRIAITPSTTCTIQRTRLGRTLAHLVLWRWRGLQKVHRWRFGRVVLGEGYSQAELLPGVDGPFRTIDGDDPHSDRKDGRGKQLIFTYQGLGPMHRLTYSLTKIVLVDHTSFTRNQQTAIDWSLKPTLVMPKSPRIDENHERTGAIKKAEE